ncbi:hypothetical protein [Cupriavidus campinensis]|uniref:Uncharacterized protein n=1 Tax=Cupriavidus campinensis TaxID=151783 RepID=A0AAE9I0K0_9BURK|nr:hypothetical protein [Cupriavidus campinensis]URF05269.1 hypothetical protein M5D45_05460 [Cupriavidus campinensis]
MHGQEYSAQVHRLIDALQVQRGILRSAPTLLSPAIQHAANELRRIASELEILAVDLLTSQRAEANGHRVTLEG